MSKIVGALVRCKRFYKFADQPPEFLHCAFGAFAQRSFEFRECHLDWIEVRRSRLPGGEGREWRTIWVVTEVSSIKRSRFARKDDCSAFSSARAAATSGRSCSAACSVFFERDAVPLVKPPDRGSADL